MGWRGLAIIIALTSSPVSASSLSIPQPVSVNALPDTMETRPVQLSRLRLKQPRVALIGKVKLGLLCVSGYPLTWKGRSGELSTEEFDDAFKDQLKALGYDVVGTSSDLFDTEGDARAEYLIGGTITFMQVDACTPNSGLGDSYSAKGSALLEVEWQIYDRIGRTVVARVTTKQGYSTKKTMAEGVTGLIIAAFGENVRALAADDAMRRYLVGERRDPNLARTPSANLTPIVMSLPDIGVSGLSEAVASTVLVQSADGHGSGFLISRDGYFLTNHHVVAGNKYVKIRWADGLEELGEVIRSDKGRDVAVIKGEARDRKPLRILSQTPEVGTEVYAIGAPLELKLQNTLTKGVLSARRFQDGYSFLQSDVSVNHGNSGGPLINAHGDVVALSVSGLFAGETPQGINFFIPAHEALEFLSIRTK